MQNRKDIEKIMSTIYNSQEKKNITLLKEYKKALHDLKSTISNLYEKMESGNISLSEGYKFDRLKKAEQQLKDRISELGKTEEEFITKSLKNNYNEASQKVCDLLEIDFAKISKKSLEKAMTYPWSGDLFSNRIWNNKTKLLNNIRQTLTRGLIEGKSYIEMARELKKLMNSGLYEALRLIRTETSHIVNSATFDRYKDSNVVTKVQIWAATDERTCPSCGLKHGKIYPFDKAPMLPLHVQCRCTILPVVEGFEKEAKDDELKAREEINKLNSEKSK